MINDTSQIESLIENGKHTQAASLIKSLFESSNKVGFFEELRHCLKKLDHDQLNSANYRRTKIHIVGGYQTDFLMSLLPLSLLSFQLLPQISLGVPNSFRRYAATDGIPQSALDSDFLIFNIGPNHFNLIEDSATQVAEEIENLISQVKSLCSAKVIVTNFLALGPQPEGSDLPKALLETEKIKELNNLLLANKSKNFIVADLGLLQKLFAPNSIFSERDFKLADSQIRLKYYAHLSDLVAGLIAGQVGRSKKVLVTDLDNTLWPGSIADDGLTGVDLNAKENLRFLETQSSLLKLKERGILLAVASKNDLASATLAFSKVPGMILRPEDFVSFQASFASKDQALVKIQAELNLGLESMVFLDDSAFERNWVRHCLPELTVIEDFERLQNQLHQSYLFCGMGLSEEDAKRSQLYQEQSKRLATRSEHSNYRDYLLSLNMKLKAAKLESNQLLRSAQLLQKTNQFRTSVFAPNEIELSRKVASRELMGFNFALQDKFGDLGIVSTLICKASDKNPLSIEICNWVLSCRAFERNLEFAILAKFIKALDTHAANEILIPFQPQGKNEYARKQIERLGFKGTPQSDLKIEFKLDREALSLFENKYENEISCFQLED